MSLTKNIIKNFEDRIWNLKDTKQAIQKEEKRLIEEIPKIILKYPRRLDLIEMEIKKLIE